MALPAVRCVHIGDQRRGPSACPIADADHRPCQSSRLLPCFHKGAAAGLDIQQDCVRSGSNLLAHNARSNQRQAVHRRCHIPQGVDFFVCDCHLPALPDEGDADLVDNLEKFLPRQHCAVTRDGFQLIHRAAGEAQPSAGHLGNRNPAGSSHRSCNQGGLVAHTACGVLVHLHTGNAA